MVTSGIGRRLKTPPPLTLPLYKCFSMLMLSESDWIQYKWSSMEPKLIEMTHKLEDNDLIEKRDYIWLKARISNLSKHFDKK
jgi:hypothetical protein